MMGRFDYRGLSAEKRREFLDRLADIVAHIRKKEEARFFLERLLTESEVVMLMRRLEVAELLLDGLTYEKIRRKLGVGTSTIYIVDKWLTEAAYEYREIRAYQRRIGKDAKRARERDSKRAKGHVESTMPGTLRQMIRHDARFILFRLLLGNV